MKTDEENEAERAELEPLIGPTRAGWYAEACDVYPEKDGHEPTLWACRYREMAQAAGELAELIQHCWVHSGYQNCGYEQMTSEQKFLYDELTSKEPT